MTGNEHARPSTMPHPSSSSSLIKGIASLAVIAIIAVIFAAATGLTSYSYALFAIGLSVVSLALVAFLRIRITSTIIAWLAFSVVVGVSALRSGDVPYAMLATIALGILLSATFGWEPVFAKSVAALSVPFAAITIAMYLSEGVSEIVTSTLPLTNAFPGDYRSGATTHYTLNGILLSLGMLSIAPYAFTRTRRRVFWIAMLIVVVIGLVLTTKRAHIAFALLSLLLTYVVIGTGGSNRTRRFFTALAVAAVAVASVIPLATYIPALGTVVDRFIQATGDESFNGRRAFYDVALSLWSESPLVGQGWGSFTPAFNMTGAGQSFIARGFESINAHNVFLQLLAETGLIGLIAFLIASGFTLICGIRMLRSTTAANAILPTHPLIVSIAIQFFFLLYCMTGNPLYDLTFFVPYFVSCSVIWSYQVMSQRTSKHFAGRAHV